MKISVKLVESHGNRRYRVSWVQASGKRKRLFFESRVEADTEVERLRLERERTGQVWSALGASQRDELVLLLHEAERDGFTLRQAVEYFRSNREFANTNVSLEAAYQQFIQETKTALLSDKSKKALRSNVGRFVTARPGRTLRSITREEVLKWLQREEWGPRTFNTYLASLNTFFRWCVKIKFLKESPAATIEKIDERRMPDLDEPPVILRVSQARRLLEVTWQLDRGLIPYVAVGLFAGLRPEREAGKLIADDIKKDFIRVRGQHAKDRQQRNVKIHPTLAAWLKLGGDLPPKNLRRRFEKVRAAAGLIRVERQTIKITRNAQGKIIRRERILVEGKYAKKIYETGWSQDCLRHSFASHYMAVFGAEKTIAQLGHGDYEMLFGHYRAMVTPDEAREFWRLTPVEVLRKFQSFSILSPRQIAA